ncbi:MAG: hypothetical protein H7230_04610 [Candidatus Parcubacteria bacterium]|nr:hypothetical protein [Candidatus Paceibacterota bacterium]
MTNSNLLTKFRKYFFVIIICLLIAGGYSFNLDRKSEYLASVSIGFSPKPQASLAQSPSLNDKEYTLLLNGFTQYLQARFATLNIQNSYTQVLETPLTKANEKKAIYDIIPTGLGYINLSISTNSAAKAQKFIDTTKEVINNKLIPEWNTERVAEYQVATNNNLISSISETKPSPVTLLIPILAALVVGSIITLLLPIPKNK